MANNRTPAERYAAAVDAFDALTSEQHDKLERIVGRRLLSVFDSLSNPDAEARRPLYTMLCKKIEHVASNIDQIEVTSDGHNE